ncbi:hypothetical protein LCGC14_2490840, partial [marine sediment metagenome]
LVVLLGVASGDVAEAADRLARKTAELRIFAGDAGLASTTRLLGAPLLDRLSAGATEHLEIETYTFGVLPPMLQVPDLDEAIAREYRWFLGRLAE